MLDHIDNKLITLLTANGRETLSNLAKKVNLSISPCQTRVKRLEEEGYIIGYCAKVDHQKINQAHIAFVQVSLSDTRAQALKEFNKEINNLKSVEQCHMIAGSFDYLLKVRSSNINDYRILLSDHISSLPHVASTSTFVSMQTIKD
jgi:Lrp/AsnC family leucine-responsive transcriptional regulator|tara:strand:+ start:2309 stop:2746 length:438 start_codon:yes stop_codon:yes gene_type:complete